MPCIEFGPMQRKLPSCYAPRVECDLMCRTLPVYENAPPTRTANIKLRWAALQVVSERSCYAHVSPKQSSHSTTNPAGLKGQPSLYRERARGLPFVTSSSSITGGCRGKVKGGARFVHTSIFGLKSSAWYSPRGGRPHTGGRVRHTHDSSKRCVMSTRRDQPLELWREGAAG